MSASITLVTLEGCCVTLCSLCFLRLRLYLWLLARRAEQMLSMYPSWKVVEELQRAVAANPEEVVVGIDPNID